MGERITFKTKPIKRRIKFSDTPEVMRNENTLFVDAKGKKKLKNVLDWNDKWD